MCRHTIKARPTNRCSIMVANIRFGGPCTRKSEYGIVRTGTILIEKNYLNYKKY